MATNFKVGEKNPVVNVLSYNNSEAFEEAKSMMIGKEKISSFFDLDIEGKPVIRMESNTRNRFPLQFNQSVLDWYMKYLSEGTYEDFGIDPTAIEKTDSTPNDFRKMILKEFVESGIKVQFTPEFRERRGRLSGIATFRYGSIFFYMDRTEDVVEYLSLKFYILFFRH